MMFEEEKGRQGDMMIHSGKLEETKLWQAYKEKVGSGGRRGGWTEEIYRAAAEYLKDVRRTFRNYTLHDETHILNVLDAMGGLLGDRTGQLTAGELELLILSACLHDLGMVYTEEERKRWLNDEEACRNFAREYCPELMGCLAGSWPEDTRQWYLRTLHPFRLSEVLQNKEWRDLIRERPLESIPMDCVLAVCQAHGESPSELDRGRGLRYLPANDTDPLFCALLLRLGDLMDFDGTRAPEILYGYAGCKEKSRQEWDKHQASAGFRYPASPSTDDLPYKARCTDPGVEHAVRDFLDWVDEELGNCMKLQEHCHRNWQRKFAFPRAVLREEIESDGYMSGDFCLTMDQERVLKLLTGENLYDDRDVFIRELLQNAIDATLLRGEMTLDFIPEDARIDLWEWNDKEGNIWFRIDDQGTGMTLGMLQRYFLKVGNSYYNSKEMDRDLREHGRAEKYQGISRFGIGFLSVFLCGDYAEVSTRYFDPAKNRKEEAAAETYRTIHYGLRLQITGLSGYYTLRDQSKHHAPEAPWPAPGWMNAGKQPDFDRNGYRAKPGTSIVVRLDPGKLGALDLREAAEKYLCGSRVPVYYNNKRIGRTYREAMQTAHEEAGEKLYELTRGMKKEFDRNFPVARGQYPKIAVTVVPLDTEEDRILPGISGVLVKYDVRFDKTPQWKVKDQSYIMHGKAVMQGKSSSIVCRILNERGDFHDVYRWKWIKKVGDAEKIAALEAEFEKYPICPKTRELAEAVERITDGQMNLYEAWRAYYDTQQGVGKEVIFSAGECGCLSKAELLASNRYDDFLCAYQGVVADGFREYYSSSSGNCMSIVFLLEGQWKPMTEMSRSRITGLPLEVLVAMNGIFHKYQAPEELWRNATYLGRWKTSSLKEWRRIRGSGLGDWVGKNQKDFFAECREGLQKPLKTEIEDRFCINPSSYDKKTITYQYAMAYFQDHFRMTIHYEEGEKIFFYEKEEEEREDAFDFFPPMMFCEAGSKESRRYICSARSSLRRGITADHPFTRWLLENCVQLNQYYERQFRQIVDCFYRCDAEMMIMECDRIREHLIALPEHHGVDVNAFPRLGMDDFWAYKKEGG